MDAEEQIWTLTRGEPRSVYSLEAVTVRAEDINDATEQRPSITSPSSVPSLFPLYRKYRLRLGKPLSFVLVFYNALATRFLNRPSTPLSSSCIRDHAWNFDEPPLILIMRK